MNQRINSFVVAGSSKHNQNIGSEARKPTGIRNEQWNYSVEPIALSHWNTFADVWFR